MNKIVLAILTLFIFLNCSGKEIKPELRGDFKAAVRGNEIEKVKELAEQGAPINGVNEHNETLLMNAAWAGYTEMVKILIEAGADVNLRSKRNNLTALSYAAQRGHDETAQVIKDAGGKE